MALAAYAKAQLASAARTAVSEQTTFKEFAVRRRTAPRAEAVRGAPAPGIMPGYALGRDYPGLDDALLVAVTEKRTVDEIDRLVEALADRLSARTGAGREADLREVAARPPRARDPEARPAGAPRSRPSLARSGRRRGCPSSPSPRSLRHFTELSTRNFGVDTGFYPLGSCTMKYNPRVNERLVGLPGFRDLHPLADEDSAQGALELEWRLQEILREVTGLDAVSLQPAAGCQGELDRPPADARLLRAQRRGRAAPQDRHPRHRPRHEPGERDDGRLSS